MKFALEVPTEAPRESLRRALADRAAVIRCIPGVSSCQPSGDGYALEAVTGLGPVRLRFKGTAELKDEGEDGFTAGVSLHDSLSGSVYGTFALRLGEGVIAVEADVTIGGRLGEFAGALLRRKAEDTVRTFAANFVRLAGAQG